MIDYINQIYDEISEAASELQIKKIQEEKIKKREQRFEPSTPSQK